MYFQHPNPKAKHFVRCRSDRDSENKKLTGKIRGRAVVDLNTEVRTDTHSLVAPLSDLQKPKMRNNAREPSLRLHHCSRTAGFCLDPSNRRRGSCCPLATLEALKSPPKRFLCNAKIRKLLN